MNRRLVAGLLAALPLAGIAVTAGPAAACQPDTPDCGRYCSDLNNAWSAVTGRDLVYCPY